MCGKRHTIRGMANTIILAILFLFGVIRGRLRPLTKNAVNGTYALVLPIDGIFAECSTRHPSDAKQSRSIAHCYARLRTPENTCVFRGLVVSQSRSLVVSSSRRPVVSQSRGPVVPRSRSLVVSLARFPAILSHSQSFPVFPSQSRASQPFPL